MTIPDYPTLFWISAILALLLVGIGKAGFGGGVGLVATPLMALTIPVADAAALLLPLLIIMDMFSIYHYYGEYDRTSIRLLLPAAVFLVALAHAGMWALPLAASSLATLATTSALCAWASA